MTNKFFIKNRKNLYDTLPDGALLLMFAGKPVRRTADDLRFFADRSFVYLTGITQEQSILAAKKCGKSVDERIFALKPDQNAEVWTGRRMTPDEISEASGVSEAAFLEEFERYLHIALGGGNISSLWLCLDRLNFGQSKDFIHDYAADISARYPHIKIENAFPQLRRQRMIKDAEEIDAARRSMEITREGILAMMQHCRPGQKEYELYSEFISVLTRHGIIDPPYKPIVCSGGNNFYLHYDAPMGDVSDGDLVLVDVGAALDFCVNDISRVFPANGRFSERQKLVHDLAQQTCDRLIAEYKPGMNIDDIGKTCKEYLHEGFIGFGLLEKGAPVADAGKYMWHGTSHYTGFDVHDVGEYNVPIVPGMIFTMDVGIYIREWGIGMRVEDNVLVTETGCENISVSIPRTVEEIERAMRG